MPDRRTRPSVMSALSLALLMVVGAAAANEDLRLVDAMKNQDLQRVRTLLDQHADVNVRSEDGSTALLWAAHWNDLQTAELLVRCRRRCERGQRLSHDAALSGVHQRKRRVRELAPESGGKS